jgi:hypothetical protein
MIILDVPKIFLIEDPFSYPSHNKGKSLEYLAYEYISSNKLNLDMVYIPIKWTSYLISANYGKDTKKLEELRTFCANLPLNSKYFTIVQYDDGVIVDIPNCLIFSAGGVGHVPIPLTTSRLPFHSYKKEAMLNFCGRINTHPIREKMRDILNDSEYLFKDALDPIGYARTIESSYFTLCPRGYGKTSFRLYEAMQLGSVPIYISDEHWLPFTDFIDWSDFCIIVKPDNIYDIPLIIKRIIDQGLYTKMRSRALEVYEDYFSYESMFKWVLFTLEKGP